MVTGRQLADTALEQARQCVSGHLSELADLAAGDLEGLRTAAELVRVTDVGLPQVERSVQHIAFTFLTAAFAQVRQQRQRQE